MQKLKWCLLTWMLALVCVLAAPLGWGQGITTGSISGNVVDPTDAVVPNVEITAVSDSTGANRPGEGGHIGG